MNRLSADTRPCIRDGCVGQGVVSFQQLVEEAMHNKFHGL